MSRWISKLCCRGSELSSSKRSLKIEYRTNHDQVILHYEPCPAKTPPPLVRRQLSQKFPPDCLSIASSESPTMISADTQTRILLHNPIYVAICAYSESKDIHLSFEKDDEMELIEDVNSSELYVYHLRKSVHGIIPKRFVKLDTDTPLRLAVRDSGIIQQCLIQHGVYGGFLIRRSASDLNSFALSILQNSTKYATFYWHYLIRINESNRFFYFSQEESLKNLSFSSFRQLITNEKVRSIIPLIEILPYSIEFQDELWKIRYNELTINRKIGEGNFGVVSSGIWRRGSLRIPVAIKTVQMHGLTNMGEQEIETMKKLTNLYIVTYFGKTEDPRTKEVLLVTELMKNGDLKSWLKSLSSLPPYSLILSFTKNILNGMSYLESSHCVHRDLACRNILLGENRDCVKIADFGLSSIVNESDQNQREKACAQKLPILWLAPELLHNYAAYSTKSDVWSFGILLIEIWLKGENPYNKQTVAWVISAVSDGYVHEKPIECSNDFYESLIRPCLEFDPQNRPKFKTLRNFSRNRM